MLETKIIYTGDMIGHLSGNVLYSRGQSLVIDTAGVGYAVLVSTALLDTETGKPLALYIHTHQTSDAITLYGFATLGELDFFETLLKVNGVGPKTALEIVETPRSRLTELIDAGDAKTLAKTPGVGPKTASRIILELRGKLTETPDKKRSDHPEAVAALEHLGFKPSQIKQVLAAMPAGLTTTEEIVKWFLAQQR